MNLVKDKKNWNFFLNEFIKNGSCDAYHDYDYLNLYKSDSTEPILFVNQNSDKLFILPFLKKRISETTYYDFESAYGYGGPISSSLDESFINESWIKFKEELNKEKIIAGIIRFHPILNSKKIIENNLIKVIYKCDTVVMECKNSLEEARNKYAKDIKNRLKKINKNSITVNISNEINTLQKFKNIYQERMKSLNADKNYFFTQNYFDNFERLDEKNWKILSINLENKLIGAAILLFSKKICNVHLSSSLQEYFKFSPNIIIRDKIIEHCYNKKIHYIHFGGGRTSSKDDSLLNFKKKFCSDLKTYFLGGIISNSDIYKKFIKEKYNKNSPKYANYFLKYRY
tara:strand:- start:4262 stop:5287 length:1026 start_codon:yes stop_codon:yes gene_type:complete